MAVSPVLISKHGAVALVTLNQPQTRNVLSVGAVAALTDAYDALERDPGVRSVVLTGAGSAFCAGAELDTLASAAENDFAPVRAVYEGFLRVRRSPLPTIGAINGPAVGAGLNLALSCDVRLASTTARFDSRFAALHLHPGGGHTWLLTRAVGAQQAMLGCLFGETWNADAALEHGLVAAIHANDALVPAAIELGQRLAGHSPEYVRRVTATLRAANGTVDHDDILTMESEAQEWSLKQPEFLDGLAGIRARMKSAQP